MDGQLPTAGWSNYSGAASTPTSAYSTANQGEAELAHDIEQLAEDLLMLETHVRKRPDGGG